MKMENLVPGDSGKYTCTVSNDYGSINHTFNVEVIGEYKDILVVQRRGNL